MFDLRRDNPKVRARERVRAKNPDRVIAAKKITTIWREKNPTAYKAQIAVSNAVRTGKLNKEPCSICASELNIHAHHKNYARPLKVIWLCARCHHRLHAIFPELEGINK